MIIHDVYRSINYTGEGLFIAGGAGITPFMPIIRYLHTIGELGTNKLIFANKTKDDIISEEELKRYFGKNFLSILSDEKLEGYYYGHIDAACIEAKNDRLDQFFYLCSPPPMVAAIEKQLHALQVDPNSIVKEEF